jgi:hypothetical protein
VLVGRTQSLLPTKKVCPEVGVTAVPNGSLDTLECSKKCRIIFAGLLKTLAGTRELPQNWQFWRQSRIDNFVLQADC